MNDLKIISFTKKELRVAIESSAYDHDHLIGLSKNKIHWLLDNDRIADDDYCVVQAKESNVLAADILLIPDYVQTLDHEQVKVSWLVNWWVHPDYENTIIGSYIYSEASRLAQHKILVESYVENTAKFYDKQPYVCISERDRFVLFFAVDEHLVISKIPALKALKFFIKPFTKVVSYVVRQLNLHKVKKQTKHLSYEYINTLTDPIWNFVAPFLKNNVTYKTKEYLNWQLSAQQYVRTPISSKTKNKAILKGTAKDIHNCTFVVFKKEQRIGFISFVRINKTIYLKYCLAGNEHKVDVINALVEHIVHFKITSIYTDDTNVSHHIQNTFRTLYIHVSKKKALAHTLLTEELKGLTLSESDGNFH